MAKSVKQQMYEQLANQHVQQALNNIGMQKFEEAYNQWNAEQDGMADFQAAYNAWTEANPVEAAQPTQQPKVQKAAQTSIPVLNAPEDFFKPKTASGKDVNEQAAKEINKRAKNEAYARQQQEEQALASQPMTKAESRKKVQQNINTEDYFRQQQEEQALANETRATSNPSGYHWVDIEEVLQKYAEAKGISLEQARKEYHKAVDTRLQSIEAPGAIDEEATSAAHDAWMEDQRKANQRQQTNYESVLNGMGNAVTAPISGPIRLAGAATGNNWDPVPERSREEYRNAMEQNPVATMAGNLAGMLLLAKGVNAGGAESTSAGAAMKAAEEDALINGATKAEALKHGIGIAGRQLAANTAAQMPFDLATDIIPTLANDVAEGKSSKEIIANTLLNTLINGGFNAIGDVASIAKTAKTGLPTLTAATKQMDLPTITNEGELVDDINKQFSNFMADYQPTFKDDSAMRNVFTPEDLDVSQNAQFRQLMEENLIPERVNPVADMVDMEDALREADEITALNNEYADMWGGADDVPKLSQPEAPKTDLPQVESPKVDTTGPRPRAIDQGVSPAIENEAEALAKQMDAEESAAKQLLDEDTTDKLLYDFNNINESYYGNREAIRKSLENRDFAIKDAVINTTTDKNGKTTYELIHNDSQAPIKSFKKQKAAEKALAEYKDGAALKERAIKAFEDIDGAINKYEKVAFNSEDVAEVDAAKRAVEAARKRYERAMKELDPGYYDEVSGKSFADKITQPYYTRNPQAENPIDEELNNEIVQSWVDADQQKQGKYWINRDSSVPGANKLQFFAEGPSDEQWKTSKTYDTIKKLGWDDKLKQEDFAYRVYHRAEQRADAAERYKDSKNIVADLLNKDYDEFDAPDVRMAWQEAESQLNKADKQSLMQAKRLVTKNSAVSREAGRVVEANKELLENSPITALTNAVRTQEDKIINPWKSKNAKAVSGNRRIAKALSDMGNKWKNSNVKPELTHDQIKDGVIAEIEKEVGSIENLFNDNDIEFLTTLAEDKSIPVWKITSEIEHKLDTGKWYTLDESTPLPKPTNGRLQSALNSLIENDVRTAEKAAPDLKQITKEVRNTLEKEAADFEGQFSDDDIDYLANLINSGARTEEIAEALNTKLATGSFGISDDTMIKVNDIFKQISNYDPNSKQFVQGQLEAYKLLANEVVGDATPFEKFEAWRYLAMLGNPKTMLRNFVGNQLFGVVTGVSNNIAALAEAGIDKGIKALGGEGIQRTKSVLNPISDMDLIKASAKDADASRYRQIIGSKYEKFSKDTLRQQKSVFNNKLLQLYEKATDAGISDYQAVKNKFSTSLAGYLKANGYDKSIFDAETELSRLKNLGEKQLLSDAQKESIEILSNDVEVLEKARDYALKQAEYATFHEDNAFASWLSEASRKAPKPIRAMIEGTVPFKKTPANVLRSGYEYSPLGAISSLKKTGKLIYENTGKRAGNLAETYINSAGKEVQKTLANDVIESWSKTLTGTALTAMGAYLYDKGVLLDSDKATKYQDQLEGLQNYSIRIGDKTYTVDWAAPAVMPLLLGAEVKKVIDSSGKDTEHWYEHLDEYLNAANMIAEPIVETSMLSGIRDTLKEMASTAKTGDYEGLIANAAYQAGTGYLSQAVPTLSGQVARTVDNTRRSTYSDKEGVAGTLEKQGRKLMNKIPGLSQLNQPYVDTYGREQENSPFKNPLSRLAYQMTSPGYLSDVNTTDADTMSRDAYNISKNEKTLPTWQSYFKDDEGKRVSPEDYTTAAKAYGQTNYEIRDRLANDEWFKGLDDAQKEEIVKGINGISEHVGKAAIDPEYETTSKAYNAYKEGGIDGLVEYYKNENNKAIAKESGLSSSSNASKAIQEDLAKGNEEAAQQKIDAALSLQNHGLTKPGPTYTYYNAQSVIPGLTTEEFASTYKKIDSNGNEGITQDELIAYLNKNHISESEANKLWKAYGASNWKSIPKLENGTWKKKKK